MRCLLLLLLILTISKNILAQSLSISGKVTEDDGKPVYSAQVFLSGTSIATVTDKSGNYNLSGLSNGSYELVVNLLGYKTFSKQLQIDQKNLTINVTLIFNVVALEEVVVKPDPHRESNLQTFKENFLGASANAKQCRIVNPEILNITFDAQSRLLEADSGGEFLIIENKALGYRIKYLLLGFKLDFSTSMLTYEGKTSYENLKSSKARLKRWENSRAKAYFGSTQHFLTSVYNGTVYDEGYKISRLVRRPNPDRPSDSLINANVKRFSRAVNGRLVMDGNDSLSYWISKRKLPKINQYLLKGDISTDTMVTDASNDIKQLRFSDCLYVVYTKEREPIEYQAWRDTSPRPMDQPNYQTSIITLNDRYAGIDPKGSLTDPLSLFFEGYWAFEKVADLLPYDYTPEKRYLSK